MFYCNDFNLLTFSYYLKFILAILMTIVPFIILEKIFIQTLKYKEKNNKLDKFIIVKDFKNLFYLLVIFSLSLILHNSLNRDVNKCYILANTKTYTEYKSTYKLLQKENISNQIKTKYLETILINNTTTQNNKNNNNIVKLNNYLTNKKDKVIINKTTEEKMLSENDTKKLNNVYVENGVFYYPNYIDGNRNTYSGVSCPSNPLKEGYNNPYGYNNYFYVRLTNFIEEAKKNGYKITYSSQGCRTYDTQVYYYNTMTRERAAYPGYSLHGFGIASDLEFYRSDGSVCPYGRNGINCPSMGWAHQNAPRFGLTFPLLNASYREDWHIEPINKIKY